jgi:hypothetical protein
MATSKCLILGMIAAFSLGLSAYANEAKISEIGGASSVLVKRAGKDLQLKKADLLQVGDELITDKLSSVDIRLHDRSLIRIGANSSYKLQEDSKLKQFLHMLLNGFARISVPKNASGKSEGIKFRMDTPEGTIGVRGTEFIVERAGKETKLKGLEGHVLFGAANADFSDESQFVSVKEGFESRVKAGEKKPSDPVKFDLRAERNAADAKTGPFAALAHLKHGQKMARSSGSQSVKLTGKGDAAGMKSSSIYAGKGQLMGVKRSQGNKPTLEIGTGQRAADDPENIAINAVMLNQANALKENIESARISAKMRVSGEDGTSSRLANDSLLHVAAKFDKLASLKYLVEQQKLDINDTNDAGRTPLIMAVEYGGSVDVVKYLVENEAALDVVDKGQFTAIQYARENYELAVEQAKVASGDRRLELEEEKKNRKELLDYLTEEYQRRGMPIPVTKD